MLFVAAEVAPWLKVGGLGDVAGSLPQALRAIDVDCRLCLPGHGGILAHASDLKSVARYTIGHIGGVLEAEVLEGALGEVPAYFVTGAPIPENEVVYTGRMDEEGHRFTFFALAARELAHTLKPDVLHCHDWHSALATTTDAVPTLLTIHNLPYSGRGAEISMGGFLMHGTPDPRVPPDLRGTPLAVGLTSADHISTVSEGYAREILGTEFGAGFEQLLQARQGEVTGILNGLDVEVWDPQRDAGFSAERPEDRAAAVRALRERMDLPQDDVPVVAVVSRLVHQKGIDVAIEALRYLEGGHLEGDFYAVILGTGEAHLEDAIRELAAARPDRVRAQLAFDDVLARQIYAGADMLLIPSRYEPCGMSQMIAMRYGCIPIARETGGLADTVLDHDLSDAPTGFLFPEPTARSLTFALRRALAVHARGGFSTLQRNGMLTDFGWRRSARDYLHLYQRLADGSST